MRTSFLRIVKYVISFSFAFLAVSNFVSVLSDSSSSPAFRVDDSPGIAKTHRQDLSLSSLADANAGRRVSSSNPTGAAIARAGLTSASAISPILSPFAPAVTATKSHMLAPGDTQANPGDTLTYTIVITNSGTSDATGVNFSDTIDPNTTLVGGSLIASPIAVNDNYNTIGNVNIAVPAAQGVISNDLNPNGAGTLSVTKVNATAVPGGGSATASTPNGSVTMSSDGSFTYDPNAAFRGPSDSFSYTLDNGTGKTDTATVTISINGLIWFVNVAAAPGGDGRLSTPFNCLVGPGCFDPAAADIANDNIFVYTGAYVGGLTLLSGQKLIGQGAGDTLLNITGLSAPSGTNLLPSTGGTPPVIAAAGANITLGSGNTIRGVTLDGAAAAAVDLIGAGFGTCTIAETTLSGLGQALNLTNGTLTGPVASTAAFISISSLNSTTTGVSLTSVAGSISSGSTSVTNPTGIGLSVNTSSASVNFGSTTSTQSGGAGVSLATNTGTITFGSLNISPDANQIGLLATDNTMTVTTTSGAISTTGAVAVQITRSSSTTPLAVSLTSVSANGGASGIVLTNTNGSFTVTGNGNAAVGGDFSGGTIQGTTSHGIQLTNVTNPSLTNMRIQSTGGSGISGTLVTNFTFANGTVTGSGDALLESNIAFLDATGLGNHLSGVLSVTNSVLTTAFDSGIDIRQGNATISNATITGNTLTSATTTATSKGSGISIVLKGDASTVANLTQATIDGNVVANFPSGAGIKVLGGNGNSGGPSATIGDPASGTNIITITGNNIHGLSSVTRMGTNAIETTVSPKGIGNFNIANNGTVAAPLTNYSGVGIASSAFGNSTLKTKIVNNYLVSNNVANSSGIASGVDFGFAVTDTPTLNVLITGNTVKANQGNGILSGAKNTNGTANIIITGNNIDPPTAGSRPGIRVDSGTGALPGEDTNVCLNISGNTTAGSGGNPGIGVRKQGAVVTTNDFAIVGLSPSPATPNQTEDFLGAQNPGSALGAPGFSNDGARTVRAIVISPASGTPFVSCSSFTITSLVPDQMATSTANPVTDDSAIDSSRDKLDTLHAARGEAPKDDNVQKLSPQELVFIVQAALSRWGQVGIAPEDMARLQAVTFDIADLPWGQIATGDPSHIKIDETAAGYGWYFDEFPLDDTEFDVAVPNRELQTTDLSVAHGKMDLLTVVMRELGHVYLQDKKRIPKNLRPLMEGTLSPAVRRMPVFHIPDRSTSRVSPGARPSLNAKSITTAPPQPAAESSGLPVLLRPAMFNSGTDPVTSSYGRNSSRMSYAASVRRVAAVARFSGETVALSVGTIPAGESVTIMFSVTIDSPFPSGVCTVTNQGHITGGNFSPVDTNSDVVTVVAPVAIGACPANITTNTDAGACTAVVTYTTPTASGCPAAAVTCVPGSGSAFPKGTTTVTCTATNGNPPDATCSFTVTVKDGEAPTCNLPAPIVQNNDPGQCSAVVTYTATASDNCPGATIVCNPASGSTFPKGTTTVNCTASDTSPDSPDTSCSFTVTVNDNEPPTIGACPAPITTNTAAGQCAATVTYTTPTGSDNCPGVSVVCSPASGTSFPKGTTTVTCTATDAVNLTATCSFTVTVNDNQPPSISCPANISATENPPGSGCATVTYATPTPTDNCPGATANCSPPSGFCFPIGSTTVTCTATDTSSNTASCTFQVNVAVACTITCPANITTNNTPGQCGAVVNYPAPNTTAGCGTVTCTPASGSFFPKGTTPVNCSTTAGPGCSFSVTVIDNQPPTIVCPANVSATAPTGQTSTTVSYPAPAVSDNCPGATFVCAPASGSSFPLGSTTVNCTATDASGNQASCSFKVLVGGTFLVNADSFLRDGADNTNEGGNELLRIQSSGHNRVVVRFNMTGIPTAGLQSASLVLNITDNSDNWGSTGRLVDAHRLLADWTEGNGHTVGAQPNFRGTGEGVTWNCAKDSNIANQNDDCLSQWNGGIFAAATAAPVLHTNGQMGDVSWNVTADVIAGANNGWIIKKQTEGQAGQVKYYSKEGAAAAGNPNLGPRLVLVYQ